MALLVLSAGAFIEPSLQQQDFFFRNLFIKTYIQTSIRFHMILVCRKLDLVIFLSNNITSILLLDCYITSFAVLYWPSCGLQVCTVSYMGRYK